MERTVHRWARDRLEVFREDGQARAEDLLATEVHMVRSPPTEEVQLLGTRDSRLQRVYRDEGEAVHRLERAA